MRITIDRLVRWMWVFLLVSIPIGLRFKIYPLSRASFEFGSFFLYPTDIVAIGFLILYQLSLRGKNNEVSSVDLYLKAFLALGAIAVFFSLTPYLSLYAFLRIVLYAGVAYCGMRYIRAQAQFIVTMYALAIAATAQAIIATGQFLIQQSIGLGVFGEPVMHVGVPGAAKIAVQGVRFLRGAGTFPHANILAGFLVIGLLALIYLYIFYDKKLYRYRSKETVVKNFFRFISHPHLWIRVTLAVMTMIVLLGLLVSFSRSGWVAGFLSTLFLFGFLFREQPRAVARALGLLAVFISVLVLSFSPLITGRVAQSTGDDRALVERGVYNGIGMYMASQHPFGVGVGGSVPFAVLTSLYRDRHMGELWMWQPAHNLFVLAFSEMGILGGTSFLVFLGVISFGGAALYRRKKLLSKDRVVALAMLLSLLIIGIFDHYLWTLTQGVALFWVVVALAWSTRDSVK